MPKRSHGLTRINGKHSPTFETWHAMLQRCRNPKNSRFKYYGGRGIAVCPRWHKFENFFADMGERPFELTLDRINNDGNYEPENCRWATISEQNKTRRRLFEKRSRLITAMGATLTIAEWARRTGINRQTLYWRAKQNWPPAKVLEL